MDARKSRPVVEDRAARDQLGGGSETSVPPADDVAQQIRRRRAAALRLPPMPCGHRDPLDCRRAS